MDRCRLNTLKHAKVRNGSAPSSCRRVKEDARRKAAYNGAGTSRTKSSPTGKILRRIDIAELITEFREIDHRVGNFAKKREHPL